MKTPLVLVVDDREDNRYLLTSLLRGSGYDVSSASNGAEALECARLQPPSIVISDILMPTMDGFALCREWQRDPELRAIPFVFYSGTYTDERDMQFALSLGAARFVAKPEEPEALLALIGEVLAESERTAPLAPGGGDEIGAALGEDHTEFVAQYNAALVRRLEAKMEELAHANDTLRRELEERTRVERELRMSEDRYSALFAQSSEGIYLHDSKGRILDVNDMACAQSGYTREELVGMSVFDLHPAGSTMNMPRDAIVEAWRDWEPKQRVHLEVEHQRKDGTVYPAEVLTGSIRYGDQRHLLAIARDITDRKRAEAELASNYALLRLAGSIARFGGWSADLATTRVAWSEAVCDIHEVPAGFTPTIEEGIAFCADEWRDRIRTVFTACAERGEPYDEEMAIVTRGGRRVWVRTIGEAVRDSSGRITSVRGAFQDITERRRAEESLRISEDKFRSLFEHMASACCLDEVVWQGDEPVDYRILDVNPAFERITGIPRSRAVGALASEIYGSPKPPFLRKYAEVARTGKPTSFEAYFGPLDKHLHVTASCPRPGRFSTVFSDITERKEAESKIADQLSELSRWQTITLDREDRVIALKQEVNELCRRLGEPQRYLDWQ